MAFLIVAACCIAGLIVGAAVDGSTAALGLFAGLAIGVAFARMRTLSARINVLRRDLLALGGVKTDVGAAVRREPATPVEAQTMPSTLATDIPDEVSAPAIASGPAPIIDSAARRAAAAARATAASVPPGSFQPSVNAA